MGNRRLDAMRATLVAFTDGCRPDMHEPDEQGVSATVAGTVLDNAMGAEFLPRALETGTHEIVVVLRRENEGGSTRMLLNLADLIALARYSGGDE